MSNSLHPKLNVVILKIFMTITDNSNAPTPTGKTAVQLALVQNHSEIMFILLSAMLSKPKALDLVNALN